MIRILAPTKRTLTAVACMSLVSMLTACGVSNGYYDTNGHYVTYDTPYNANNSYDQNTNRARNKYAVQNNNAGSAEYNHYNRRGYYDRNGDFIATDDGLNVPDSMFPPRGMCRVWFTQRSTSEQPAPESCNGIKARVPAGAYVIYGG